MKERLRTWRSEVERVKSRGKREIRKTTKSLKESGKRIKRGWGKMSVWTKSAVTATIVTLAVGQVLEWSRDSKKPQFISEITPTLVPTVEAAEEATIYQAAYENPVWPETIKQWSGLITKWSNQYQIDPDYVAAIMWKESWFDPEDWPQGFKRCDAPNSMSCTSISGARCAMQVMPKELGFPEHHAAAELRDPNLCIGDGVHELARNIQMGWVLFPKKSEFEILHFAAAAYNAGPSGALAGGGKEYADKVVTKYLEFKAR